MVDMSMCICLCEICMCLGKWYIFVCVSAFEGMEYMHFLIYVYVRVYSCMYVHTKAS